MTASPAPQSRIHSVEQLNEFYGTSAAASRVKVADYKEHVIDLPVARQRPRVPAILRP